MEKRLVLAIVLSMAVIMVFSWHNARRMQEVRRRAAVEKSSTPAPSPTLPPTLIPEAPVQPPVASPPQSESTQAAGSPWDSLPARAADIQEATCIVEDDLWRVELTNLGAVPVSWKLLQYRKIFPDARYLTLRSERLGQGSVPPGFGPQAIALLEKPDLVRAYQKWADYFFDRQELNLYEKCQPYLESDSPADRLVCAEDLVVGEEFYPASPFLCRWGERYWDTSIVYEGPSGVLRVTEEPVTVTYTAQAEGVRVSKVFTFRPGQYRVDFRLEIENLGDQVISDQCLVTWQGGIGRPCSQRQKLNSAHVASRNGDILSLPKMPGRSADYAAIAQAALSDGNRPEWMESVQTIWRTEQPRAGVRWVGIDTKYFVAALVPSFPVSTARIGLSRIPDEPVDYLRPAVAIDLFLDRLKPGQVQEYSFAVYAGPKEASRLGVVDETLEDLTQNYWLASIVSPIARLLLYLLQFFYHIVPNYGVGIILLTVLVRLLMYPLYHKQMLSMKKMQALQPQINALKERYKDNPQELQRKTMEFYREHKVNPMAGCLTMLPMMPIFIALWGTFNQSIELRGAPFVGWIQDLSQPDQAFFIPIGDYIIPINILPLIYCALMLWSQSRQKIEGPNAAVMKILPVFFVILFWSIASGVILYFVISMSIDTAQRMLMDRFAHQESVVLTPAVSASAQPRRAANRSQSRRKR